MAEDKHDPIPEEFKSIAEAGAFWDVHSAADYVDDLQIVDMEFDLQHGQIMVPVEGHVYMRIKDRAEREQRTIAEMIDIMLQRELAA